MKTMDIQGLGEIIRKIRKERRLRLEDLADENISPATISNIERGVPHVSTDKAMYLLKKLEISLDQIPTLMMNEQAELAQIQFKLLGAESFYSNNKATLALEILDQLDLDDSHPYAAEMYYQRGKCYQLQSKWKRAERSFYKAIQLSSQQGSNNNIEAASFCELGLCCYRQNDLDQALQFVESGLDAFVETGERKFVKYALLINKAVYLERLGRLGEGLNVVMALWENLKDIDQIDFVLTTYWLRSELLRRSRQLNDAIKYAKAGVELARRNRHYNLLFDLWTVLGSIYMDKEQWQEAEFCFHQLLNLDGPKEHKFITAYARLGKLYIILEKWDQAYDKLVSAVTLGEKYNDAPRLDQALQTMGDYYRSKNDPRKAISYYQRCLELAERHGFKKRKHHALFRLAQCWDGIDEEEFQKVTANMYKVQAELNEEGVQAYDET
jgi:tetratricopeptide (TPR) repeat protein